MVELVRQRHGVVHGSHPNILVLWVFNAGVGTHNLYFTWTVALKLWCSIGASLSVLTTKKLHEIDNALLTNQVLCENIGRINFSPHFA